MRRKFAFAASLALVALAHGQPTDDVLADWNNTGGVTSQDYTAFLNDWTASEPETDLNEDGSWTSADVTLFNACYAGARLPAGAVVVYLPASGLYEEDIPQLSPWDVIVGSALGPKVWDSFDLVNPGEVFEYLDTHPMNDPQECVWCDEPADDYWAAAPGRAIGIKSAYAGYYWEIFEPMALRAGDYSYWLGEYEVLNSSDPDYDDVPGDGGDYNIRVTFDAILIGYPTNPYQQMPLGPDPAEFQQMQGMLEGPSALMSDYADASSFIVGGLDVIDNLDGTYSLDLPTGAPTASAVIGMQADIYDPWITDEQTNDPEPKKWDPYDIPFRDSIPITLEPETPGTRPTREIPTDIIQIEPDTSIDWRPYGCDGNTPYEQTFTPSLTPVWVTGDPGDDIEEICADLNARFFPVYADGNCDGICDFYPAPFRRKRFHSVTRDRGGSCGGGAETTYCQYIALVLWNSGCPMICVEP